MSQMTDLDRIAEDAARFAWKFVRSSHLADMDEAAFAAAYPILRDEAAANAVVDRLVAAWEDERTVDELPEMGVYHGMYRRMNGQWFMAYNTRRPGPWGWYKQTPHEINSPFRRRDVVQKFDELLARSS